LTKNLFDIKRFIILAVDMKKLVAIFLLFFSINLRAEWVYDAELKIWYNTETGEIRITGDDDMDGDVGSIRIFNNNGQEIPQSNSGVNIVEGSKDIIIPTNGLSEGTYIAVFIAKDGSRRSFRFVVY
jgi:hypothetical protein